MSLLRALRPAALAALALAAAPGTPAAAQQAAGAPVAAAGARRPMSWLDMHLQQHRSATSPSLSPDGRWLLYALTTLDWKDASRQSDLYLVSTERGVPSTRQLTSTPAKNETRPRWAPGGRWFAFVSNRDATGGGPGANQLYLMRPDSGQPRRITAAPAGVTTFDFSPDGRWLVYRSGRAGAEQLHALPTAELPAGAEVQPQPLTRHATGVGQWQFSPDAGRIYFVTADTVDRDERTRTEKGFTVTVRNAPTPTSSLWALELDGRTATRLTTDTTLSVHDFVVSADGRWIGYRTLPRDRYRRNGSVEQQMYADLHLLETATGRTERLTRNEEAPETALSFSPDGRWMAYAASDDTSGFNLRNLRVYLRRVDDPRGAWRKLGSGFDGDVRVGFWSPDSRTIYFNAGVKATTQVHALDVATGAVRALTNVRGTASADLDDSGRRVLVRYSDPATPPTIYTVPGMERIGDRRRWTRLTDLHPETGRLALGETEEITWTSADGTPVGGVLVKPVGYQPGRRYPLMVILHGGPHSAELLEFNGDGDGAQVYAGAGYLVLAPNYRGSSNYGEAFKLGIVGSYFDRSYQDVMAGVDHLIARGLADSTRMGVLGHSAGGSLGNWILTHTDRFRAISSGAGVVNWISMYAGSDIQRYREYQLGGRPPYADFESYWSQSPLRYIANAKTPTLVYATTGDPRVPSGQAVELYMALQKLGVPTELFMYPGEQHGTPGPRNRLLNSMAEMAWMDYHVRGSGRRFAWRDVLATLEEKPVPAGGGPAPAPAP